MKLQKRIYTDRAEKRKDLLLGAGLFFGLNVPLYLILLFVNTLTRTITPDAADIVYISLYLIFPLLINIVLLVYFGLTRSQVALGMLAAFGALLVLGLIVAAACFVLIDLMH